MAPAKECNAGLRLINANLVADGSGRDAMLFFDSGYRGGKQLMTKLSSHQNHASSVPYPKKVPMDKYWNKLELRPYDNTQRVASLTTHLANLKESRMTMSMPRLPSSDYLFERDGVPSSTESFSRTRGSMSTGTLRLPQVKAPPPPAPAAKFEFGKGDAHRHQYTGIARTPYGGFWRTMSMTGPG